MYKIPANTLFLGKRLVFVPECHSTNSLALQLSQDPSTPEGSVIITSNQTAGRGQRGNSWEAEPGMNLTFSVILRPHFLSVQNQFSLAMITALAIKDYLADKLNQPLYIKWPNDILVHNKKISGILVENQLIGARFTAAVLGIGLNVNQTLFKHPAATSLKILLKTDTELENALHEILRCLEARYLQLRQEKYQALKDEYIAGLYWINEKHRFSASGTLFEGVITGLGENGKLAVDTHEGIKYFGIKEITFVS